ncbi:hypothetical protein C2G38_2080834 [Gigaspora rosea]|uniref:F-box domain-containing protein n=1 Tax=Gigaspora rosea TaxID=44941 RepID=A0A397VEZ9_9GLOM|nr:hypothetical protein C2G38_2080834 [Gigaspora rosea]
MSIPILWREPFEFSQSPLFISKYFSSLGKCEKIILKEYGINEEFSKTIFDYPRFLKALDLSSLYFQAEKWIELVLVNSNLRGDNRLKHNIIIDITNLLLKLLIENGATLHSLELRFSGCREFKPEIFYVLGQNEQFLSQLQHLSLSAIKFDFDIDSATTWLKAVAKYTTKISTLNIEVFYLDYNKHKYRALINVIKSQKQLRLFGITGVGFLTKFHSMISALESQKNSLQEVRIDTCTLNEEFEVLKNCKNLETLRIRCCDQECCDQELSKLSKILDNKIGNKISTLEVICCQIYAQPIALILRLELNGDENQEYTLLEALKSFCPNIIYLDIMNIKFSTKLVELISDLQKLQFLSLQCYTDGMPDEELKKRVMQAIYRYFAQSLQCTFKKLLIHKIYNEKISKALIEFCIRNKTLNYVGVYKYLDLDDNIRKEVEAYVELVTFKRILVYC